MIDNVLFELPVAYDAGVLTLRIDRQIEIKVPAEEARRSVNHFVHMEISTQMHAETPVLVVGDRTLWRVPIHLTFPSLGDVGDVGSVDVDPITGSIDDSPAVVQTIIDNASDLALRFAHPTTHRS